MIHIIDTDKAYFNTSDRWYYFKNETSKRDYPIIEVSNLLVFDGDILPTNQFNIVRKKKSKTYFVDLEENLSTRCFYFGEVLEDNCSDISLDFENSTCVVVATFFKKIRTRCINKFAVVLSSRNYVCFDVVLLSGEKFKTFLTYDAREKQVIKKNVDQKRWEAINKGVILSDYDDGQEIEVGLDMLETFKNSAFNFNNLGGKFNWKK